MGLIIVMTGCLTSAQDHLMEPLERYIAQFPKITLVRAPERVGLIRCGRNMLALLLVNMHDDP